jgi:hypothetical protein
MKIYLEASARRALTDDEYKYLRVLSLCDQFDTDVNKAREQIGMPPILKTEKFEKLAILVEDGYSFDDLPDVTDHKVQVKAEQLAVQLLDNFGMPISLYPAIAYIILLGANIAALEPMKAINIYNDDVLLLNEPQRTPFPIIQLNKRLSQRELFDEIAARWRDLERAMMRFELLSKRKGIQHLSVKDIDTWCTIHELREEKVPYEDIRKILKEKNIHMQEESIRKFYTRYLQILKKHFPL